MRRILNSRGVALLQALVMVNVMALTAAAMLIVIMSGFMGTATVEQSIDNRGAAEAAIAMAYEDLHCYDPNVAGTWTGGGCTALYSTCSPLPPALPANCTYATGAGNVQVDFTYASSSYTLTARGNVQQ
ncbi:MAG: hypothetical protein HYT79_01550 [Elusimicrobia bacterium]|nr:hypothetical protein [Elusimicrobiota bacterium]